MSWKSFACVAALSALMTGSAFAAPSLTFIDNADGTGTFQIAPDATLLPVGGGSIAFEIEVDLTSGAFVSGANGALFPTANPGDFDAGISSGLNIVGSTLTAAYGSDLFADGTAVDALTIDFGAAAGFDYVATVAQAGLNNPFTGSGSVTPGSVLLGDVNLDGVVDGLDITPFVNRLTTGTFQAEADINIDLVVDGLDITPFVAILTGGAVAVPEPSSLALVCAFGVTMLSSRRKS